MFLSFLAGCAIVCGPILIYLGLNGALDAFYYAAFEHNLLYAGVKDQRPVALLLETAYGERAALAAGLGVLGALGRRADRPPQRAVARAGRCADRLCGGQCGRRVRLAQGIPALPAAGRALGHGGARCASAGRSSARRARRARWPPRRCAPTRCPSPGLRCARRMPPRARRCGPTSGLCAAERGTRLARARGRAGRHPRLPRGAHVVCRHRRGAAGASSSCRRCWDRRTCDHGRGRGHERNDPPKWIVQFYGRAFSPPYDARVQEIFDTRYEVVATNDFNQLLRLKDE